MGRTSTEIQIQLNEQDKVNRIIQYMQSNGYEREAYDGYETWVKPCIPIWSQLNRTYHYVQFQEVGNTLIVDEWVTNYLRMQMDVSGILAIIFTLGSSVIHHNNLINFLRNL